jgi:hypothetical protein
VELPATMAREVRMKTVAKYACIAAIAACVTGCHTGEANSPPREQVRAGVVLMARVVSELDHVCASTAQDMWARGDEDYALSLAKKCAEGYELARSGLLAVSDALDSYDSADMGAIGCGVSKGLDGLTEVSSALKTAGVDLPSEVDDALAIAKWLAAGLGGQCPSVPATSACDSDSCPLPKGK